METIKSSTEVSSLFNNGKHLNSIYIKLIVKRNSDEHGQNGRVVFIAGKKLGNAVWRNRSKRRMKAIARDMGGPWPGYDVGFVAKTHTTKADYSKVLNVCEELLIHHKVIV